MRFPVLLQSKKISRVLALGALSLINLYQILFPKALLAYLAPGGACKYEITCSEYTKRQIMRHGILKGSWLGIRRIISCR